MVTHPMVVGLASTLFGGFILWAFAANFGWLRDGISDEQLEQVASKLLHDEKHYKRLVHLLRENPELVSKIDGANAKAAPLAAQAAPAVGVDVAQPTPTPVVQTEGPKILAMIVVRDGQVQMASNGARYDPTLGLVHFDNPAKQPFVPMVSTIGQVDGDHAYLDTMHYIGKDSLSMESFRVARVADVDLPDQTPVPRSFSAIVVAGMP